jgi:peptide/nickel transport system permease protein
MTGKQNEVESNLAPPTLFNRTFKSISSFLTKLAKRPLAFIGFIIVVFYLLLAFIGPSIAPYDYSESLRSTTDCRTTSSGREICSQLENNPPSTDHPFGTDRNGRDIFSRVLHGARDTIGLPTVATIISVFFGMCIGLAAGYFGGWIDEAISRVMDSLLAIPALILALVMLTTIVPILDQSDIGLIRTIGSTNISLIIVIVLLYTPIVTRVIRSATLGLRESGYVEAAKLRGENVPFILFREILPGVLPALIVEASLRFSYAIFLVASLGFLGLGVQPPIPEWGRMVLEARSDFITAPWGLWFPVLAIAILIISVNLLSDGLRFIFRYEGGRA